MADFAKLIAPGSKLLDIGSFDVNGNYRDLFTAQEYIGMDIEAGPNVDVVQPSLYAFPFSDASFDVVVSGNVMEHVEQLWQWVLEVDRVLKPGGLMCHITPHTIHYHPHPVDCWRVRTDGMTTLWEKWMRDNGRDPYIFIANKHEEIDTVFIGRKAG